MMAATSALAMGCSVELYDRMPSIGRKFLMAGKGGLNLTHSESAEAFPARYGAAAAHMAPILEDFGPKAVIQWCEDLGFPTVIGSSGRVFPADFKAAPLLRAWIRALRAQGATIHTRHRWTGWNDAGHLTFDGPVGLVAAPADTVILALGGGSWPNLGSDGLWPPMLSALGIPCTPLKPSNCGFDVGWSAIFRQRHGGDPVKTVALSFADKTVKGDLMITATGIEGGAVYALSPDLRDAIETQGTATLLVDLCPSLSRDAVTSKLAQPRGSRSQSTHLARSLGLSQPAQSLLRESCGNRLPQTPDQLAQLVKQVPVTVTATRPLSEAISTAGGVAWDAVDGTLMIKSRPGVFLAGEMLDWEAPTGGYLLTGCLATGYRAGRAAAHYALCR